jgi:hypothetical protein
MSADPYTIDFNVFFYEPSTSAIWREVRKRPREAATIRVMTPPFTSSVYSLLVGFPAL